MTQQTITPQQIDVAELATYFGANPTAGIVSSIALADGSTTAIYSVTGSPVTSSGTLTFSLKTQTANFVFAGPSSGSAAQPTFRSLVTADFPTSGVTAGTYGSSSAIPIVTVDATGRVTTASTATISAEPALTATFVGYGGASNTLTGTSDFTWTDSSHTLVLGAVTATSTITAPTGNGTQVGGNLTITAGANGGANGGNLVLSGGGGATATASITINGYNDSDAIGGSIIISAINGAGTGGINPPTFGSIIFETGTGSTATQRLYIDPTGTWYLGGSAGTAGQAITSHNPNTPPSWTSIVNSVAGTSNEVAVSASTGAVTLSLPQNVIIPTPSSGVALAITGSGATNEGLTLANGYISLTGPAATILNGIVMQQGAQGYWQMYQPASSTDLTFFNSAFGGVVLSVQQAGGVTISAPSSGFPLTTNSSTSAGSMAKFAGQGTTGNYIQIFDNTNSAERGFIGYGSAMFTGGSISDFGIASNGGALKFSSNGGSSTALQIDSSGNVNIVSGALELNGSAGTSGQVLTSAGPGALPTWSPSTGGVTSVTGTSGQITASPTTGAVVLSIPTNVILPSPRDVTSTLGTVSAGTIIVDFTAGNVQRVVLGASGLTVNLTNVPTTQGQAQTMSIIFVQDATGSRTLPSTFQVNGTTATVNWDSGVTPVLTTTANKADIIQIMAMCITSATTVLAGAQVMGNVSNL